MILGVGLDIVDVGAFSAQLADPASGFVEATFRPGERRSHHPEGHGESSRDVSGPASSPRQKAPGAASAAGAGAGAGAGARARPSGRAAPVRLRQAQHLAGHFAAKEALIKAWSAARRGRPPALAQVDLRDIEVTDDGYGRPGLRLHGAVRDEVAELAPGAAVTAHLSISHDGPVAAAVVILEA